VHKLVDTSLKLNRNATYDHFLKLFAYPINGFVLNLILNATLPYPNLQIFIADVFVIRDNIKLYNWCKVLEITANGFLKENTSESIHRILMKVCHIAIKETAPTLNRGISFRRDISVLELKKIHKRDASDVLAKAHYTDPLFQFICGNSSRLEKSQWFFRRCLTWAFSYGRINCVRSDNGTIIGVSVWQHQYENETSLYRLLQSGLASIPRILGPRGAINLSKVTLYFQEKRKQLVVEPHLFLFSIGIIPQRQRQGFGSVLLQPILKIADENQYKCYVECTVAESVSFFRKWGFEVVYIHDKDKTIPQAIWHMIRLPKS